MKSSLQFIKTVLNSHPSPQSSYSKPDLSAECILFLTPSPDLLMKASNKFRSRTDFCKISPEISLWWAVNKWHFLQKQFTTTTCVHLAMFLRKTYLSTLFMKMSLGDVLQTSLKVRLYHIQCSICQASSFTTAMYLMPFLHIIALTLLICSLHSFWWNLFKMHRALQDSLGYQGKQEK